MKIVECLASWLGQWSLEISLLNPKSILRIVVRAAEIGRVPEPGRAVSTNPESKKFPSDVDEACAGRAGALVFLDAHARTSRRQRGTRCGVLHVSPLQPVWLRRRGGVSKSSAPGSSRRQSSISVA